MLSRLMKSLALPRFLLVSVVLLAMALNGPARATAPAAAPVATPGAPPRLIAVIVIDQFRDEFLSRFADRLGTDGFRRLEREGAHFTSCFYPYALTETAPGHATLATGTTPDRHGIVSNEWYDRATHLMIPAVEDEGAPVLNGATPREGVSPRSLKSDTFADGVRLRTGGRGKSFGLAGKARAAVLSTGESASGAFWFDTTTGRMTTSRYYGEALPGWVAAYNRGRPADRYYGRTWTAAGSTLARMTSHGGSPDAAYYEALAATPYLHEMLFAFARETIENEHLGEDGDTDFLFIGLSGHDYLGHEAGPYSEAVAAMTRETDAQLAAFLRYLDKRLGRTGYWVALSADHGVAPTAAQSETRGMRPQIVEVARLEKVMAGALSARFGAADPIHLEGETTRVWFDLDDMARHGTTAAEAARLAGEAASKVEGVRGYLAAGSTNLDAETVETFRLSTFPGRSPDLFLALEPFAVVRDTAPANHGTAWSYDTQVPLLLYGPPFRPGVYRARCSPADLAPTLAAALGIPPPALATGRVLGEALR